MPVNTPINLAAGDTLPVVRRNLIDALGVAIDLTDATVTFRVVVGSELDFVCSVVGDATDGVVQINWGDDGIERTGRFPGQFVVEYGSGHTLHVPNNASIPVIVTRAL